MIRFNAKTEVIITDDLVTAVCRVIEEEKCYNIGILVDNNVASIPVLRQMMDELTSKLTVHSRFFNSFEPTTSLVDEVTGYYRPKEIDFFIGIGGGSTIDLTKAVSAMVVNAGSVEEYHGTGKPIPRAVRKMMIPTTAGTGSEVTPGAVLVNERTAFKRGLSSACTTPDIALLCAPLTTTLPDNVTASTGLDALGHAIESYTAKNSNTLTKMYSREAFRLLINTLDKVFRDRSNGVLRRNMLLGANMAGFAIFNSNTGAAHSMAYPTGIYYKVPHGLAVARILPQVVSINVKKGCNLYADLYDCIDDRDLSIEDPNEKSRAFCEMFDMYPAINYLGKELSDFGINETNYEFLAERGLDLTPALSNNPVEFTLDDAKKVLRALI